MSDGTIYESKTRSAGDVGAVFEWDGDTGYFYLCAISPDAGPKILQHLHILSGGCDFGQPDVKIRWDAEERMVGLLIRGQAWAAFDAASRRGYGGGYSAAGTPDLPLAIQAALSRQ